jgi:uncharacterized Ntn-hydrolase superfamily protein
MLRPLLALLFSVALLAPRASATWSIILIDTRTGEIAVASATCLENFDLAVWVPIVVTGVGAGCAQSFVDPSGGNRLYIRDQLRLGTSPAQILAGLAARDASHQTRQYGIVDVRGRALGFTGTSAGAYAADRVGQVGDIAYAIQGNVLTAGAVLAAAEVALFTTPGDLGEKMMAAMEAAYAFGGDGRCSCSESNPTRCGAPPPGFQKSAHVAFMITARPGDTDGGCEPIRGCASGSYYMRLNVAFQRPSDPDPVLTLRQRYDQWKASQRGRPDHFLSTIDYSATTLPLDGRTTIQGRLTLRDREGNPVTVGGASVQVVAAPDSTAPVTIGAVTDNGDGTYGFPVTAGTTFGRVRLLALVDDGSGPRQVRAPEITTSRDRLWVSRSELSIQSGGTLDFSIQPGAAFGRNKPWVLLASLSGTSPGIFFPPFYYLPLNPDALFNATLLAAFDGIMPELIGYTGAQGLDSTSVRFPPGLYGLPAGRDISWAYALFAPVTLTSNAVGVRIVR